MLLYFLLRAGVFADAADIKRYKSMSNDQAAPSVHYLYNTYFFAGRWAPSLDLPGFRHMCSPEQILSADVLMVHLPSILSTNTVNQLFRLREIVPKRQIWVAESMESVVNYPQMDDPGFMSIFHFEASYRQQADVWIPYIPSDFEIRCGAVNVARRGKQCCAFVSAAWDKSNRQAYIRELMGLMRVDSYGRFMRNKRLWFDKGEETKLRVLPKYTYTLAFENSICPDYVTEKFFQPLMTGTVPIYLGASNIEEFAPGDDCYINATDFSSPADLAAYLDSVDPARFHAWRMKELRPSFRHKLDRLNRNWRNVLAHALIEVL